MRPLFLEALGFEGFSFQASWLSGRSFLFTFNQNKIQSCQAVDERAVHRLTLPRSFRRQAASTKPAMQRSVSHDLNVHLVGRAIGKQSPGSGQEASEMLRFTLGSFPI